MDYSSIINTVVTASQHAIDTAEALFQFLEDSGKFDQQITDVAARVECLGETCTSTATQLKSIAGEYDTLPHRRLWLSIETRVRECDETLEHLNTAFKEARSDASVPIAQAWSHLGLEAPLHDLSDVARHISTHTTGIQANLQAMNVQVAHLSPQLAGQTLIAKLGALQRKVDFLERQKARSASPKSRHQTDFFLECVTDVISSGQSLYASSVAGGTASGTSFYDDSAPTSSDGEAAAILDKVADESVVVSGHTRPIQMSPFTSQPPIPTADKQDLGKSESAKRSNNEREWEQDFDLGVAEHAFNAGCDAFSSGDYDEALGRLKMALELLREVSEDKRRSRLHGAKLRYMLAVCIFHQQSPEAAEVALEAVLRDPGSHDTRGALDLCNASHLLSITYVRLGKLEAARSTCNDAVRGRWKMSGRDSLLYFDSLALLARVSQLQNDSPKATTYGSMIPQELAISALSKYAQLQPLTSKSPTPTNSSRNDSAVASGDLPPTSELVDNEETKPLERTDTPNGTPLTPLDSLNSDSSFSPRDPPRLPRSEESAKRRRILDTLGLKPRNPFQEAVIDGRLDRAWSLPRTKSKLFRRESDLTDLQIAALCGEEELVRDLIAKKSKLDTSCVVPRTFGLNATALHFAVAFFRTNVIRLLLNHGSQLPSYQVANALISVGVFRQADVSDTYSPLATLALHDWCLLADQKEPALISGTIKLFMEYGWDINSMVSYHCETLLHMAARLSLRNMRQTLVEILLALGADVMSTDQSGRIPLHRAIGYAETVELLLRQHTKKQIVAKDDNGDTALHHSLVKLARLDKYLHDADECSQFLDGTELLIRAGASPLAENRRKKTPVDMAKMLRHDGLRTQVLKVLQPG